ncbi:MAG TPA: ThuA domain-containing protein [Puia sp.]|jgi:glucose/arabinose dehydrogenase/cytochrome c551/c552|nr:ThuA domain-containing protein [Puia sp.]
MGIVLLSLASCTHHRSGNPRILVFSKTTGYHHASIADGNIAIQQLGKAGQFDVDTTTDASWFVEDSLKKYAAVVFLSTTGNVLDYRQRVALERYIQAGGGYVGIHAAADCEYDWHWYGRMVGGYFLDHPGIHDSFPNIQEGVLEVADTGNDATKFLPRPWKRKDEYYSYKELNKDVHVLLKIDETSYNGGHKMGDHPMAWYHEYDGGRAFYTELGHTSESYHEENYLKHLLAGIRYAIGDNNELDYTKAKSPIPPDEDRFVKTQLSRGEFFEPTEMTILPNLDILILQRRGEIMRYKHDTKQVKQVGFLDVYYKAHVPGVNAEEGMLGLAKDPDFAQNHYVYIYYSPADSSVNRLSRFTFINDTIDRATEKTILEVKAQREICCHTGGSIAFGPDSLLYFSTGDNSTPFDERGAKYVNNGFAPLNDLPGHQQYDARRSAGNSNDLRGKIIRIRVKPDGSYEIPAGNLFPVGEAKTRPEIYVMGDRNPYRISIDQKTGYLYWGEVGPDANDDSFATRGPRGYDEVNQARKAGYFGWPLFVGDNYAYHEYDYATGKSGPAFDPEKPVNDSRNNTGLRELPPAQPAFIWYPYGPSHDFPEVGTGGRNAMAGPVYYPEMYPDSTRLPDYYNGKLIIYEWMRGWMKAVTMLPNGDFDKMEPFAPGVKMNSVIDMEVGPDGKIYLLEYGTGWFTRNPDAGLARIDYIAGNRAPVVSKVSVDRTSGLLPFTVKAGVEASDPEKGKMSYEWDLGNGVKKETTEPVLDYTYTNAGDYTISVVAKDDEGAMSKREGVSVYAGNSEPVVSIELKSGNRSFYLPGTPIGYQVSVKDNDTAAIDPGNLYVAVDYLQGYDKTAVPAGHQEGQAAVVGRQLTQTLDCKSCHKEADKSIGPAFLLVAQKYHDQPKAANYLSQKIIKGGSGVWGDVAMSAHPNLSGDDVNQIVTWILSLGNKSAVRKSLPQSGSVVPPVNQPPNTAMVISASYTDKGGNNVKALTGKTAVSLRSNSVYFTGLEKVSGFTPYKYNDRQVMIFPAKGGWIAMDSVDLTGVRRIDLACAWQTPPKGSLDFEVRLDGRDGKVVGRAVIPPGNNKGQQSGDASIPIAAVTDGAMHSVYILYAGKEPVPGGIQFIQFNSK